LNFLLTSCQLKHPESGKASVQQALSQTQHIRNGVQLQTGELNVKVQFYAENMVRVVKWVSGGTAEKASLVVIQTNVPDLNIHFQEDAGTIRLGSANVTVQLSKRNGAIQYLTGDNQIILKEQGEAMITPVRIAHETNAFSVRQNFKLTPDEGIYGLGQHQSGYMNYRGHTVKLVQPNTQAVTPFLISAAGYGLLWDNYSKSVFSDDPENTSLGSEVADNIDYYFIYGRNLDQVIAGYRELTGQAPMYGRWAYGYWQSKEHYANRDELLGIAQQYRKRRIQIDNIVQDWDYWGGNTNLYEDENDNYIYEKGVHATIDFHWDDANRRLTIDDRKGSFPGMLKQRSFNIVIVGKDHGTGVEITDNPDKTLVYQGERQIVPF
jgi:alpha-D-xyloside xylohydrolase